MMLKLCKVKNVFTGRWTMGRTMGADVGERCTQDLNWRINGVKFHSFEIKLHYIMKNYSYPVSFVPKRRVTRKFKLMQIIREEPFQ